MDLVTIMHVLLDLGNALNGAGAANQHHRCSVQFARGFKLESLAKLKSTKSFNRRTTALHFLVANIERCIIGGREGGAVAGSGQQERPKHPLESLFEIQSQLPTLQAAKRLVFSDSLSLIEEMRKGVTVLETEMAKMTEQGTQEPNSKLEEFVDYVKISIAEVENKSRVLQDLMLEAGNSSVRTLQAREKARNPPHMFNLLYDFLEALNAARLERNQVDICHKIAETAKSPSQGPSVEIA